MTYLLALALVLFGVQLAPEPARHVVPPSSPDPRYVIWDQHARDVIVADWDRHATDPVILERAYCLSYRKDVWVVDEWVWRVTDAVPAHTFGATPSSIVYECEAGQVSAHVHPDATCVSNAECVHGGTLAFQCFPSETDERTRAASGWPFAVIICDRNAYRAFGPGIV